MTAEQPRVLIATLSLTGLGGTDHYTRDLAVALLHAGWLPIVYATYPGIVGDALRQATIPVITRLDQLSTPPAIIHGHHTLQTLSALMHFPTTPAVFVCHDALTWHSIPPRSPRIGAYAAVDRNCRDRMISEHGIPEQLIQVMPNAVALRRFPPRSKLPSKPRRALVFSNQAKESTWVAPIRSACGRHGIELDVIGLGSGRYVDEPETVLGKYDLVFGKARCALEALATGTAVIVCDAAGLAGMVTSDNVAELRQLNFGARTLASAITSDAVEEQILRYDPDDAARVSETIRRTADVETLATQFIALYDEVRVSPRSVSAGEEFRSVADSLENLSVAVHMPPAHSVVRRMGRWLANSRGASMLARLIRR